MNSHTPPAATIASPPDAVAAGGSSRRLRVMNDRTALAQFFLRDRLTRPELVEFTGFSKPTASQVIKRLSEAGLVTVVGRTSGGPGPRADVYALNPDAGFAVTVSVREPDTVAATIVDLCGQSRADSQRTMDTAPEDAVVAAVAEVRERAGVDAAAVRGVWVTVPGSYDARADRVRRTDMAGLDVAGLRARLAERLATEVRIDNDVNLATLAERHHGVGGTEGFALLWLGETGIGLGIDLGDAAQAGLLHGFRGAAGELGYLPCGVGRPGAPDMRELVAGPAIVELSRQHGRKASDAGAAFAAAGEADDAEFFAVVAERVAFGLASVVTIVDPAMLVLAGPIGVAGGQRLRAAVAQALDRLGFDTPVACTAVTGDAVMLGGRDAALATVRRSFLTD